MNNKHIPAPLGHIEPHAFKLKIPADDQLLYKVMTVENLLCSITGNYLHFNRVDSYTDSPIADTNDGLQLPKDQAGNVSTTFLNAPNFTAANYYDQSRGRTYACCFSAEESDYIWKNYGNGSVRGKVCVVFEFGLLRTTLNQTLQPENTALIYNGIPCRQIFSVNYGLIDYVPWETHQINNELLANPIDYTFLKDEHFHPEKEFRISLSAPGFGKFALNDGILIEFPTSLKLPFNFKEAIANKVIQEILIAPDSDSDFLRSELSKLCIESS